MSPVTQSPGVGTPPLRGALVLAVFYLLTGGAWIVVSSVVAAWQTGSETTLLFVEIAKGLLFVGVTGAFLFGGLLWLLRRQARLAQEAAEWRDATAQAERRAVAGVVAASVAHDINNVIMILSSDEDSPARQRGLERLTDLARRLQRLGQQDTPEHLEDVCMADALRDLVAFVRGHEHLRGRHLHVDAPETCRVHLPRLLFERALLNVLLNAGEATPRGGTVCLRLQVDGPDVAVVVEDSGPGLPADPQALLQPGVTTRGRGTGLGLLPLRALAERLEARIVLERSEDYGGARVGLAWNAARVRRETE